jgi:hypothetical protein
MERAVTSRGIQTVNLYDLFANVVPGVYFLLGLYAMVRPVPLFRAAFHSEATLSVGLSFLLIVIVVAFITGQLLQIGGSAYDGDHGFDNLMWAIRGRDVETRYDVSDVERPFWNMCRSRFELTGEFEAHDRLFKLLLSFLEQRGRARALRMQALYLFVRGVFVASVALLVLSYFLYWGLESGSMSAQLTNVIRSQSILAIYIPMLMLLVILTEKSREGAESDWIVYTVSTAYLEMIKSE